MSKSAFVHTSKCLGKFFGFMLNSMKLRSNQRKSSIKVQSNHQQIKSGDNTHLTEIKNQRKNYRSSLRSWHRETTTFQTLSCSNLNNKSVMCSNKWKNWFSGKLSKNTNTLLYRWASSTNSLISSGLKNLDILTTMKVFWFFILDSSCCSCVKKVMLGSWSDGSRIQRKLISQPYEKTSLNAIPLLKNKEIFYWVCRILIKMCLSRISMKIWSSWKKVFIQRANARFVKNNLMILGKIPKAGFCNNKLYCSIAGTSAINNVLNRIKVATTCVGSAYIRNR